MPSLKDFSDNNFRSRQDILTAATALLRPLTSYKSPCGARVKLSTATGAGFDELSAQLEGFARPLWVVAELLSLKSKTSDFWSIVCDENVVFNYYQDLDLSSWVRGLEEGVNPNSKSFWGHLGDHDQRMVEMEPIAYALLSAPLEFLNGEKVLGGDAVGGRLKNLKSWLNSINSKVMPLSNWRWFRVLVNVALIKFFGVSQDMVKPMMDADFEVLDSFYLGKGWSSDGVWSKDKRQVDYYAGSFGIQYSQLLYIRFAADLDPERAERYRIQAKQFSTSFWRYFDVNGAAIPFGRSLSYRFAFVAFFAAVVVAGVDLPKPLNELGVVKGLILRHLRWWAAKTDYFNSDGTISIGYAYPNMFMSEDYNSPQSVYWCLKVFSIMGLADDHEFWRCDELPHPLAKTRPNGLEDEFQQCATISTTVDAIRIGLVFPALHIICSLPEHHFLLSAGQYTEKRHRAREAKYGKFAYSSAFAFSVPTGNSLEQIAPDSTLCISNDDGDSWRVRWDPIDAHVRNMRLPVTASAKETRATETIPVLVSRWRPWKTCSLEIESVLIPGSSRWPGWHVRIHKLSWNVHEAIDLKCVDSGFAITSQSASGAVLPPLATEPDESTAKPEGVLKDSMGCLILSEGGACGAYCLNRKVDDHWTGCASKGFVLKPDANTNLVAQRSLIPTIYHEIVRPNRPAEMTGLTTASRTEAWFATGIFAVSGSAGLDWRTVRSMWKTKPVFE